MLSKKSDMFCERFQVKLVIPCDVKMIILNNCKLSWLVLLK